MNRFSKKATLGASRAGLRPSRRRALPGVELMEGRVLLTTLNDLPRPFIDEWHTARSHGVDLGSPTSGVIAGLRGGGQVVRFQNGLIYSSASGVHEVHGAIGGEYAARHWEWGP